jgi:hypothetical protein
LAIGRFFICHLNNGLLHIFRNTVSYIGFTLALFLEGFYTALLIGFLNPIVRYLGCNPLLGKPQRHS